MKTRHLFFSMVMATIVAVLTSCSTPKDVAYFQDFNQGSSIVVQNPVEIKFKADDEIRILVSTREKELSDLFSLYANSGTGGGTESSRGSRYTIDSEGCIRFPILGKIHVAGLNRQELQETIRDMIIEKQLVKDPIVTVDYSNLYVVVLGDVGAGRVNIDRDKFTLLDALSAQGDLAITGQRQNVKVIRENYGKKTVYEVNLCSAEDLYASPVYYLQQNDVIYVEQNNKQKRNSTVNGNSTATPAFWMSLASFLVGVLNWF
ncbi:MAG: polysaccharide biosynthesis/export family protein [Prevotellaceae bacterium]|nr:polysaccharide biosynthesis/export family protein [Candidatus Minthosoma caballi]